VNFHPQILQAAQKKALLKLGPVMTAQRFYLGGGTALALQLGHRRSVDLDWFTQERIADPLRLAQDLNDQGVSFVTRHVERGTLHGSVSGVRVSLLEYRYPLLQPPILWPTFGCKLASLEDLACMKLSALSQRGAKKDFVDIYALGTKHCSLSELLGWYQQKYAVKDLTHVLYSLAYFDDADRERLPRMFWASDWRTIKKTISQWVRSLGTSSTEGLA
jgi:predicted nucleotidyltransferase component of viral defense system